MAANLKNMFSATNLFEFLKSNIKIVLLSVVVYGMLRSALPTLITLPHGGLTAVAVARPARSRSSGRSCRRCNARWSESPTDVDYVVGAVIDCLNLGHLNVVCEREPRAR